MEIIITPLYTFFNPVNFKDCRQSHLKSNVLLGSYYLVYKKAKS